MTPLSKVLPLISAVHLIIPVAALAERVRVGSFEIDQTEVTVAQFASFADRTGLVTAAEREGGGFEWGAGWQRREGWNFRHPFGSKASPDEPAVHISWHEADNYCADAGGRLPAKEEWVSAAYSEQRPVPTDGFTKGQTYVYPVGDSPEGMNNNRTAHVPVGTTRSGVNGLYDMGANAWEWLADRRDGDSLTAGGSWWYGPQKTKVQGMQWKPADFYVVYIGFRCVYG
ncbi:MAG: formylglycine-generating enzyme family protein [Granulosicoccus sp.]